MFPPNLTTLSAYLGTLLDFRLKGPRCCPWHWGTDTEQQLRVVSGGVGFYRLPSSENLTFHKSCSSGFHYERWPRANTEMGLARVQDDCKTNLIPNIWKNEEKGRGTHKALAAADVWVPLCPSAAGGGKGAWSRRKGARPSRSEQSRGKDWILIKPSLDSLRGSADHVHLTVAGAMFKVLSGIIK